MTIAGETHVKFGTMTIDTRAGSRNLVRPLRERNIPIEESILPAGDVEIVGRGPEGRPVLVGVEYKSVGDVLHCIRDGRFAEQLRRMRDRYEVRWLLVEGYWAPGVRDELLVMERGRFREARGQYKFTEVASWLLTMAQAGGCLLWRTPDMSESVSWLCVLRSWWTQRDWESHRSHLAMYMPPPFSFRPLTPTELMANTLDGLGPEKLKAVAAKFKTPHAMTSATVEDWASIDGIGKVLAERFVAVCQHSSVTTAGVRSAAGGTRG